MAAILAAANPKEGRFDTHRSYGKQLGFDVTLLIRFDLIFVLRDEVERDRDTKIARMVLKQELTDTNLDHSEFLKKYILNPPGGADAAL